MNAAHCRRFDYGAVNKILNKRHYSKEKIYTYYLIPFVNSDKKESRRIYESVKQIRSALYFYMNRERLKIGGYTSEVAVIFYPIIVVDGELFSVLIEKDATKLKPEKHIQVLINTEFTKPIRIQNMRISTKPFIIDVARKDYFEDFLKNIINQPFPSPHTSS